MLGTQAVETIHMLLSTYFRLRRYPFVFRLQRHHYICQQDLIYINIKLLFECLSGKLLRLAKILPFQGGVYAKAVAILHHVLFLCAF